ncbi:MAG: four helix bundle protein [Gemmatimonadaceae bacterium]
MADFKKLRVWKKAHALALNADRVAAAIRDAPHRSLRGQMNRAAMSIPTNIVGGRGKKTDRDFARYLGYALGSACELEYHITLARDVGAISEGDYSVILKQVIDIKRMLHGLIDRLSEQ